MRTGYVNRIKANISIFSSKKTANLFDGSYRSVYKGSSLNFEDLREYQPGDNVRDIDWKASSRNRNLLVRRYIAEKKHNILLVFDSGSKMSAQTADGIIKKELAILTGGTIGYLAGKNGDYVGSLFDNEGLVHFEPFRLGLNNLEFTLASYDGGNNISGLSDINKTYEFLLKNINRKMIIFWITDSKGISEISDSTIEKLQYKNDLLAINIKDGYMTSKNSYDVDRGMYVPEFISRNKRLNKMEVAVKNNTERLNAEKLKSHGIANVSIENEADVVPKLIELLEKHKNANIG